MKTTDTDCFYTGAQFQQFFKKSARSLVMKANPPHFTILAVSDDYLSLTHTQRDQLLGKGLFEIFPGSQADPSEQNSVYSSFVRAITTKEIDELPLFKYEIYVKETGLLVTEYWTNINEPLLDEEGNVVHLINTTTNITKQILAQQALEEASKQADLLVKEQALTTELKASIDELRQLREDLQKQNEDLEVNIAQQTEELATANEELLDSKNRFLLTADKLKASEEQFRKILYTMAEGVGITDAQGNMVYSNPMASQILGISESEIKSRTHYDDKWYNKRLDGSPLPPEEHPISIALANGKTLYNQEFIMQPPSMLAKYISMNATPLTNEKGTITGAIGTFSNITEKKQDEQRKNDFISMVSHELKTPLTSISAYIQLLQLQEQKGESRSTKYILDKSYTQVKKMTTLINGFLNMSRLESGKIHLDTKAFDVEELVKEIIEEDSSIFPLHQIHFNPCATTRIHADREKIGQVITNFISNAVKYAYNSKVIDIACQQAGGQVTISVTDYGEGIPPEEQEKIFERYHRVAGKKQSTIAGFGIGLYLCAEIISRHHGQIGVTSEMGKGSIFWFSLPIV